MIEEIIVVGLVASVFFLLGRELVCWYFKINEKNALLKDIRDRLDVSQSGDKE